MSVVSRTAIAVGRIAGAILVLRGERVLLDADLAALYGVDTRTLNQAVRRNLTRFPPDFMFRLNTREMAVLRSQSVISNPRGGRRSRPYAFTEQGIAMLSSVVRSERAVAVNIEIMRTFVRMRRIVRSQTELARTVQALELKCDGRFSQLYEALRELTAPRIVPKRRIGSANSVAGRRRTS